MKSGFVGTAAAVVVGVLLASAPSAARAKSFTVNVTGDAPDATPGDGFCGTTSGLCTLRAAIEEANRLPGADVITIPAGRFTLDAGALDVTDDLTIAGAAANRTQIDAQHKSRVFQISGPAIVTISQVTIQHAFEAEENGGGLVNAGSTLSLNQVTFANNKVNAGGGGLLNLEGNVTLTNVTFSHNRAGDGGGLTNYGGNLTLTNVTFAGNTASNGPGALENAVGGTVQLTHVTFTGNQARGEGSSLANGSLGTITLTNTIVSGRSGCSGAGHVTSLGHNIDSGNSCGFNAPGDLSNVRPRLGTLSTNGGSTKTVGLRPGSPAIDAGDNTVCPATDQRGITRPQGAGCDIGAYELQP